MSCSIPSKLLLLLSIVVLNFTLCISVNPTRVYYNSQFSTPLGIQLADATGDGITDFVITSSPYVYTASTDFISHGQSYSKLPTGFSRIITGRFDGVNTREIFCAQEPAYTRLDCYILAPTTLDVLWWYWYQPDFIGSNQAFVLDYDGDGKDDILTYNPTAGTFGLYVWNPSTWFFQPLANWYSGNLAGLTNMQIRVVATQGKSTLLAWSPSGQWIAFYGPAIDGNGYPTYWWAYSYNGITTTTDEVTTADINGDGNADLVLHDTSTGSYLFYTINSWGLGSITTTNYGQLDTGSNTRLFWAKLKTVSASEDSGRSNIRNDALVFDLNYNMWVRSDARYDTTNSVETYWWVYSQYAINLNADQDGDAIYTKHELGGYDHNNDGVSDLPLQTYGASPFSKDVFVHVDYMAGPSGASYNYAPTSSAISCAVQAYADKGLNLHIFLGSQVPYQANLGSPTLDWSANFDPIKNTYFPAARKPFFHYSLFANAYGGGSSSGIARGIPAQDFIVSVGFAMTSPASTLLAWQCGTLLHELGHTMGLHHGNVDDVNYKPNDLSIMNYLYQVSGIWENGAYHYYYSDCTCSDLNEAALNDLTGVKCATGSSSYDTLIESCGLWTVVNNAAGFDFNRDGIWESSSPAVDINIDGVINTLKGGANEYANMVYNGGGLIGGNVAKRDVVPSNELIEEADVEDLPPLPENHFIDESKFKPHNGTQFVYSSNKNYPEDLLPSQAIHTKQVDIVKVHQDRLSHATFQPNSNTDVPPGHASANQNAHRSVVAEDAQDWAINKELFGKLSM